MAFWCRPLELGWKILLPLLAASVLAARWYPRLSGTLMVLNAMIALTFRDPERKIQRDPNLALAPADGRVMRVETIWDDHWQREMREVAIFLAIWDVHVQRVPADGTVAGQERKYGRNRTAISHSAADVNNQILTYLDTPLGPLTVNQITGMVARRLINWTPVGAGVVQGQRLGMIVLGSQVTLRFPLEARALVMPGDIVRGGVTPLARYS